MTKRNMFYNKEQVEWLKENAYGHRHKELTEMFNKEFGTNLEMKQIRRALQIRKISNGLHHHPDVPDEIAKFIYDNYEGISNQELIDRIYKKFGVKYNRRKMKDYKWRRGLRSGIKITPFEKRELLSELTDDRGYTFIKVGEYNWIPKHRYLYEKHIGKIPKGHVVVFKDGNSQNFDLDNLMLADRKLLGRISSLITKDAELNETIILNAKLKIKVRELEDSINEC